MTDRERRAGEAGEGTGRLGAIEALASQMIQLAVPKELGMTEAIYRSSLPSPAWDPEASALGFDHLVLVEPRVDFWVQLQHANIVNYLSTALLPDPGGAISAGPYWLQVDSGQRHLGRTPRQAESSFLWGERGLTALEGISLVLQYPHILAMRCLDLPGSRTPSGQVPCLGVWYNRVGLFARGDDIPSPIYGAATCFERKQAGTGGGKRRDHAEA